jgi:thioredoxin 1
LIFLLTSDAGHDCFTQQILSTSEIVLLSSGLNNFDPTRFVRSGPGGAATTNRHCIETAQGEDIMSEAVLDLTDANFDEKVLQANTPVLVDLWAPWCAPCRMVAPAVEALAAKYDGQAVVGKLNVDENPGIARKYGVTSIPTLLFFKGGEVADHMVGVPGGNAQKVIEGKLKDLL